MNVAFPSDSLVTFARLGLVSLAERRFTCHESAGTPHGEPLRGGLSRVFFNLP